MAPRGGARTGGGGHGRHRRTGACRDPVAAAVAGRTGRVAEAALLLAQLADQTRTAVLIEAADQTAGMPEVLASAVRELVAEYEAKESPEAVCARDADKLECLLQGIEYKAQGYENAQRWIDNSRNRLVTGTANRLADELLAQGTIDWLRTALGEDEK
ncbi:HD domain-containing protein [Streptomyces halstedii]|uniref:HD domain-containing protein n=1 Tax=Streptomyces halstedii TaxID=1944 RepID=UPI003F4C8BC0